MGFLSSILPALGTAAGAFFGGPIGGQIGGAIGNAIGGNQSPQGAATQSGQVQQQAANQAANQINTVGARDIGRLNPFMDAAQFGINNASFLTDPNQQFQFLQNNPLFQMGLDNANTITNQSAAARGRLSAGDTLQQLNNNSLLVAQPLINQQSNNIRGLLNLGTGIANSQNTIDQNAALNAGNFRTSGSAAQAAGIVGASNANQDQLGNMINLGTQLAGNSNFTNALSGLFGGSSPPPGGGYSNAPIFPQ